MAPEQGFARPHPEGGETHTNGDGEPRRRRRGRRGGRRNRRDGAPGNGDFAAAQGPDIHERPEYNERPDRSPREAPTSAVVEAAYAPPFEPVPRPEPCAAARGFGSRPATRGRTRTAAPPLHGSRARAGFQQQRACGNSDADGGTAASRAGRIQHG